MFADYPIKEYYASGSLPCGVEGEEPYEHHVTIRTHMPDDVEPPKLTRRVADYWESLGLPASVDRDSEKVWEAHTRFYTDFTADLIITTRGGGQVTVRAGTPCLPEPGSRIGDSDSSWPSLPPPE